MSDFQTDEATEAEVNTEATEATEASTDEAKGHKARPAFGLQIVGAQLPEQEKAKRGDGGRGPDMRIHGLLTELAELDPRNAEGEAEWALLVTYTTASGARETLKSINEGNRPVPDGLAFEYDVRRWNAEVDNGAGEKVERRVSGLFAKFVGAADEQAVDAPTEDAAGTPEAEYDDQGFPV